MLRWKLFSLLASLAVLSFTHDLLCLNLVVSELSYLTVLCVCTAGAEGAALYIEGWFRLIVGSSSTSVCGEFNAPIWFNLPWALFVGIAVTGTQQVLELLTLSGNYLLIVSAYYVWFTMFCYVCNFARVCILQYVLFPAQELHLQQRVQRPSSCTLRRTRAHTPNNWPVKPTDPNPRASHPAMAMRFKL